MSSTRIVICLLIGGWLWATTAPAHADVNYQPYEFSEYFHDARWFEKFDGYPYDEIPKGNQGLFIQWNTMKLLMSSAETAAIGATGINRQAYPAGIIGFSPDVNSLDTGIFTDAWHGGNDTTIGYMQGQKGWSVRWFDLWNRDLFFVRSNTQVVFDDPDQFLVGFYDLDGDGLDDSVDGDLLFGRDTPGGGQIDEGDLVQTAVIYEELEAHQRTDVWTFEINYTTRLDREVCGAYWESFCGLRFMMFKENFNVDALGGVLADSFWGTEAENRLIGPQVGVRWFRTDSRWTFDGTARAMAAVNFQNLQQVVGHGAKLSQLPPTTQTNVNGTDPALANTQFTRSRWDRFHPREFVTNEHEMEIAPVIEASGRSIFHITRSFSIEAGIRAMYMDGIARPASMVVYRFPSMGIDTSKNHQRVLMLGGFVGFNINR